MISQVTKPIFVEPACLIVAPDESSNISDLNEPPGKKFRKTLRRNGLLTTSKNEDDYCADDEAALENTSWSWPNIDDSGESDWDKISSSSGMNSSDDPDDPDWEHRVTRN